MSDEVDIQDVTSAVGQLKVEDNIEPAQDIIEGDAIDAAPTRRRSGNVVGNTNDASQEPSPEEPDARLPGPLGTSKTIISSQSEPIDLDFRYNMSHPQRGTAIIINNKHFQPQTGMNRRNGTDVDAKQLTESLTRLGFDVKQYDDLTTKKMQAVMQIQSREDHSDSDCLVVAILSHGDDGIVYGVDGTVSVESLTKNFRGDKSETLVGKPKIFLLQACRGQKFDEGILMKGADQTDAAPLAQRLPVEADFLICYSTVPGYYSWRNAEKGSWFVQAVCNVLDRYGTTMDMLHMMTRASKLVAYNFESNTSSDFMNMKKQIPCTVSMLTKDLYFPSKS
ncbi:caspase-3-like [Glandiceps talaboti]